MTTIEEVVETWDNIHQKDPNVQTWPLEGKNVQPDGKIESGRRYGRLDKWAVIKLSDAYPFAQYNKRICYVFDFKSNKPEINFQRRSGYPCDTEKLYEFLDTSFNGKEINGKRLTLDRGRNPDNLILKINFDKDSPAKEICDCMEELIKLTQKPICVFLETKTFEELNHDEEEATANSYYGDDEERRKRLAEKGDGTPKEETRPVKSYKRDADVKAEVLKIAKGICAKCEKPAPFKREHGRFKGHPYLEVHHKIRLSEGGKDNVENAVALCPNCHKEEHYGKRHWN